MALNLLQTVTSVSTASWDLIFCISFIILIVAILVYAAFIPQGTRCWWFLAGLTCALTVLGMTISEGWVRILMLDAAAFSAVALVWTQESLQAKKAARTYLILMIIAVFFIAAGIYLAGEGNASPAYSIDKTAVFLLVVGFSLKLALVPFYFWLPKVAEHSKPMTTVIIVSVVDIAAFSELAHLRLTAPWVFNDYSVIWLVLALLSMFGGAVLALAQKNIKRMLAFSTIDDMGYLVLGTLAGTQYGINGAMLAALSHAFFKMLLFGAVGIVENGKGSDLTLDDRGMAARYPVSAAVFILGALGMIGVPPFFGFVGRWRLYLSGLEYGGVVLVLAMAAATALALLYYVRVIHRVWLGKPETVVSSSKEPRAAAAVLLLLLLLMLAVGLYPGWLTGLIG